MSYAKRQRIKKQARQERQQEFETNSLRKLRADLQTRCSTIFVGAVAKIEKHFGHLWGEEEDLDEDDMTPEQKHWYEAFLDAREEIFDQGNDQLYKLLCSLDDYHIVRNRNSVIFTTGKDNGRQKR